MRTQGKLIIENTSLLDGRSTVPAGRSGFSTPASETYEAGVHLISFCNRLSIKAFIVSLMIEFLCGNLELQYDQLIASRP